MASDGLQGMIGNSCEPAVLRGGNKALRGLLEGVPKVMNRTFKSDRAVLRFSLEVISMAVLAPPKERTKQTLPLEERIRQRAYELYVQRGNQSGSEVDDWFQAEDEIRRAEEQQRRSGR